MLAAAKSDYSLFPFHSILTENPFQIRRLAYLLVCSHSRLFAFILYYELSK